MLFENETLIEIKQKKKYIHMHTVNKSYNTLRLKNN